MKIRIVFLGTGGGKSILDRCAPSIVIERKGKTILLDCGPHTFHQSMKLKINFDNLTHIIFSHLHFDHSVGLPELLLNSWLKDKDREIKIHIPKGSKKVLNGIINTLPIQMRNQLKIKIIEDSWIKPSSINENSLLYSNLAIHGDIKNNEPARNIKLEFPEGIIVYSGDSAPSSTIIPFSKNADILIHESTHPDKDRDLAHKLGHSTPSDAAKIAKKSNVNQLILTHISVKEEELPLIKAKKIFNNIILAHDFYEINLK
ncbi:MAG: MBL fold metallo-hydrolase [Candidatus Ranarchaeia archaeon]